MSGSRIPGPLGAEAWQRPLDTGTAVLAFMGPPAPVGTNTVLRPAAEPIDDDVRMLAATAYGEGSTSNVYEEMAGIANVLVRQQKARGHASIAGFIRGDRTFAYAAHDGNARFERLRAATEEQIAADAGMSSAVRAARNALAPAGTDYSNGAYFWDGADIRSNYSRHPKVRDGIRFGDPAHNIYGIDEKDVPGEEWWRNAAGQNTRLRGQWSYKYESTAAYGGTIFWRYNPDFVRATGNREHR